MPKMSAVALLKQQEQATLTIRTITKVEALPVLIGESYAKITAYLNELGEVMTDVPFIAYHNMDMKNLDVEIGFPVSKALSAKDNIRPGTIPEGLVVFCMYRGAFSEMEPVYAEMSKWIEDNGYQPTGMAYEYYYNGPEFPESDFLTKIVLPIQ